MSRFSAGIAEIVLIVADVPRSAAFYEEVVGLEPLSRTGDEWAWFLTGEPGTQQRLAVHKGSLLHEEHSPHPEGHRFGNIHFALDVPRNRFEAAVEHVRGKGVDVYGPEDFDWMKATAYYFYDPESSRASVKPSGSRGPRSVDCGGVLEIGLAGSVPGLRGRLQPGGSSAVRSPHSSGGKSGTCQSGSDP
jgi:catechol 2,3-dioxygenase-like lactoylglutathione lyase family enzyme